MMIAAYISFGILFILTVVVIIGRHLALRSRPQCPVHKRPMAIFNEETGEYACATKGCTWCADIDDEGNVDFFRT